jgi:NADPH:quinone reductase-like Zn-dependent oxidoreductase
MGTPPPDEPPARIPGFDAAGVVVKLGPDVSGLAVGDEVFTMIGRIQIDGLNGSYAEYVIAPADNVVHKPESFSFAEAAGLGTVGLTAARTLDPADIEAGDRVFIDGIAGGVGSSAAQIAKAAGATVIGTASARHHEYLQSLGVDQVVDYTKVDFVEVVEPVDVYFETVNGEIAVRGLGIIKPGGRLVSVAGAPDKAACDAAEVACPVMGPPPGPNAASGVSEGDYLRQVAELAEQGEFRINIDRSYPLAEAAAGQEYNRAGHTQGKVILIVRPDEG